MENLAALEVPRDSLSDRVYDSLRSAIIGRDLAPGQRVTEAGLAKQLQVSKTPVREALLRLELVGLVETDGRSGRIATPSPEAIESAYEVRIALETQAARLAAQRGSKGQLEHIGTAAAKSVEAAESGDAGAFRQGDRSFHFAVAAAAGNSRLESMVRDAFDLTWTLRQRDVPNAGNSVECANQHLAIAAAIKSRDPEKADVQMRAHQLKVQGQILEGFRTVAAEETTVDGR